MSITEQRAVGFILAWSLAFLHYKVQKIVLSNVVKLELPSTVKIYLVVNVSRIQCYVGQVEGQKKKQLAPVIIKEEKE